MHSPLTVHGYIHGIGARSIIPFPVFLEGPPRWVFFMFDTGAPQTFITEQVCFPPYSRELEPSILKNVGEQRYRADLRP